MMGGWEGWERWTRERDNDRRRAATRNARIQGIGERWGPTVEDGLTNAMVRYLALRFPDPIARLAVCVAVFTDLPDQHAGSLPIVARTVARIDASGAASLDLADLRAALVSWREQLGERIRVRLARAEHPATGDVARWLEPRLDAWLIAALGRHR